MVVLETPDLIFLTSGKTGTQSLSTIEGVVNRSDNNFTVGPLCPKAVDLALSIQLNTNKKLVIVIRDPLERMYSGLFEVIVKLTHRKLVQLMPISVTKDPNYWVPIVEDCLKLSARSWNPEKEFESHRWQYHIGNWLVNAQMVKNTATDVDVVDIKDLNAYLACKNISSQHKNKYTDVMPDIEQSKELFTAFVYAIDRLPSRKKQILEYLAPEIERYNQLKG